MQRVCQLGFLITFNNLDYSTALDAGKLESDPAIGWGRAQHDPLAIDANG